RRSAQPIRSRPCLRRARRTSRSPIAPGSNPAQDGRHEFSAERDRGRADDEAFALVALDPDVELRRARALVLLGDGAAEPDGAVGQDQPAERDAQTAELPGTGPALDQRRQQAHAHVSRGDHSGQAFAPRALVIGEAREVVVDGARVGAHLVLGEEEGAELVAFLDLVAASDGSHGQASARYIMRLSTTATRSPRWFVMVKR